MKRYIKNVFADEEYNCFACGPHNPIGLHLQFYEEDEYVKTEWEPSQNYEGYPTCIHGGIQAVLLDEIAAWTLYIKEHCAGVTSHMSVRYCKKLDSNKGKITVEGKIKKIIYNFCYIDAYIYNSQHEVCAKAEVIYYMFSKEDSIEKYRFPTRQEDFYL